MPQPSSHRPKLHLARDVTCTKATNLATLESIGLHHPLPAASIPRMESHEWKEQTDEGRRFYRANFRGGRWTLLTTTMKRDPVWEDVLTPTLDHWRELRTLVWNKYQRKRCPWERVEGIDREIEKLEKSPARSPKSSPP